MSIYPVETQKVRLLRIRQVLEIVPVSRSTIWQWVRDQKFPAPVRLGDRVTVWRETEVLRHIEGIAAKEVR
jgi:prophage regulatory protein